MKPEYELRILNINPQDVAKRIIEAGGKKVQDRILQQRYTYDVIPADRNTWVRLRTNGTKTTLAVKKVEGAGVSDTKEVEIEINDFETGTMLLKEMGIKAKSYQENYRAIYELYGAEIMLDEWPLIPPYVEVEAESPELVKKVIQKLGFDISSATGLDVSSIFETVYRIDIDTIAELTFDIRDAGAQASIAGSM